MPRSKKALYSTFGATLLATIACPAIFPALRLSFFAPFLVMIFYRRPLVRALWWAFLAGIVIDLLSYHQHLGIATASYLAATAIVHRQTRNFFEDKQWTLAIMVFAFVVTATVFQGLFLHILEQRSIICSAWVGTDLIVFPVVDAAYAFLCFTLPAMLTRKTSVAATEESFVPARPK